MDFVRCTNCAWRSYPESYPEWRRVLGSVVLASYIVLIVVGVALFWSARKSSYIAIRQPTLSVTFALGAVFGITVPIREMVGEGSIPCGVFLVNSYVFVWTFGFGLVLRFLRIQVLHELQERVIGMMEHKVQAPEGPGSFLGGTEFFLAGSVATFQGKGTQPVSALSPIVSLPSPSFERTGEGAEAAGAGLHAPMLDAAQQEEQAVLRPHVPAASGGVTPSVTENGPLALEDLVRTVSSGGGGATATVLTGTAAEPGHQSALRKAGAGGSSRPASATAAHTGIAEEQEHEEEEQEQGEGPGEMDESASAAAEQADGEEGDEEEGAGGPAFHRMRSVMSEAESVSGEGEGDERGEGQAQSTQRGRRSEARRSSVSSPELRLTGFAQSPPPPWRGVLRPGPGMGSHHRARPRQVLSTYLGQWQLHTQRGQVIAMGMFGLLCMLACTIRILAYTDAFDGRDASQVKYGCQYNWFDYAFFLCFCVFGLLAMGMVMRSVWGLADDFRLQGEVLLTILIATVLLPLFFLGKLVDEWHVVYLNSDYAITLAQLLYLITNLWLPAIEARVNPRWSAELKARNLVDTAQTAVADKATLRTVLAKLGQSSRSVLQGSFLGLRGFSTRALPLRSGQAPDVLARAIGEGQGEQAAYSTQEPTPMMPGADAAAPALPSGPRTSNRSVPSLNSLPSSFGSPQTGQGDGGGGAGSQDNLLTPAATARLARLWAEQGRLPPTLATGESVLDAAVTVPVVTVIGADADVGGEGEGGMERVPSAGAAGTSAPPKSQGQTGGVETTQIEGVDGLKRPNLSLPLGNSDKTLASTATRRASVAARRASVTHTAGGAGRESVGISSVPRSIASASSLPFDTPDIMTPGPEGRPWQNEGLPAGGIASAPLGAATGTGTGLGGSGAGSLLFTDAWREVSSGQGHASAISALLRPRAPETASTGTATGMGLGVGVGSGSGSVTGSSFFIPVTALDDKVLQNLILPDGGPPLPRPVRSVPAFALLGKAPERFSALDIQVACYHLIYTPAGRTHFTAILQREFCLENLLFLLDALTYRRYVYEHLKKAVQRRPRAGTQGGQPGKTNSQRSVVGSSQRNVVGGPGKISSQRSVASGVTGLDSHGVPGKSSSQRSVTSYVLGLVGGGGGGGSHRVLSDRHLIVGGPEDGMSRNPSDRSMGAQSSVATGQGLHGKAGSGHTLTGSPLGVMGMSMGRTGSGGASAAAWQASSPPLAAKTSLRASHGRLGSHHASDGFSLPGPQAASSTAGSGAPGAGPLSDPTLLIPGASARHGTGDSGPTMSDSAAAASTGGPGGAGALMTGEGTAAGVGAGEMEGGGSSFLYGPAQPLTSPQVQSLFKERAGGEKARAASPGLGLYQQHQGHHPLGVEDGAGTQSASTASTGPGQPSRPPLGPVLVSTGSYFNSHLPTVVEHTGEPRVRSSSSSAAAGAGVTRQLRSVSGRSAPGGGADKAGEPPKRAWGGADPQGKGGSMVSTASTGSMMAAKAADGVAKRASGSVHGSLTSMASGAGGGPAGGNMASQGSRDHADAGGGSSPTAGVGIIQRTRNFFRASSLAPHAAAAPAPVLPAGGLANASSTHTVASSKGTADAPSAPTSQHRRASISLLQGLGLAAPVPAPAPAADPHGHEDRLIRLLGDRARAAALRYASRLMARYIDSRAELCVNLPARIASRIAAELASGRPSLTLFFEAEREILNLLARGPVTRFIMSAGWKTWQAEVMSQAAFQGILEALNEEAVVAALSTSTDESAVGPIAALPHSALRALGAAGVQAALPNEALALSASTPARRKSSRAMSMVSAVTDMFSGLMGGGGAGSRRVSAVGAGGSTPRLGLGAMGRGASTSSITGLVKGVTGVVGTPRLGVIGRGASTNSITGLVKGFTGGGATTPRPGLGAIGRGASTNSITGLMKGLTGGGAATVTPPPRLGLIGKGASTNSILGPRRGAARMPTPGRASIAGLPTASVR